MQTYVYIVFKDNYPKCWVPTLIAVYRTRAGAQREAERLGTDSHWVSSVKVVQQ